MGFRDDTSMSFSGMSNAPSNQGKSKPIDLTKHSDRMDQRIFRRIAKKYGFELPEDSEPTFEEIKKCNKAVESLKNAMLHIKTKRG